MKKILTILCGSLAVLALAACSADDNDVIGKQQPVNTSNTWTVTTEAHFGGSATTRALSESGTAITATFATGENIYAYSATQGAMLEGSLQPKNDGASATLEGALTGTIGNGDALKLIYPQAAISYDGQKGTLADIAANFDFATATVSVTDASTPMVTTTAATFTPLQAITKFTFTDGTSNISVKQLTISGTGLVQSISADGATETEDDINVTLDEPSTTVYVAMRNKVTEAQAAGSKTDVVYAFTAIGSDGKIYAGKKKAALLAGENCTTTVAMTHVTDLSMLDCAGNPREARWTANCYMVHTAGDYALPLVYGNAIKNGATNAVAYSGVKGDDALSPFTNHAGKAISDPWIKNHGIAVKSAELLWQDAPGLITKVGIGADHLLLTVGKDATTQEGNALIAVKDASGTIVWSWHIWLTKQDFTTLGTVNTGDLTYRLTPVNLGWVGETVYTGYCTYYQWGRKDAFIPAASGSSNNDHAVYDIDGNATTGMNYQKANASIGANIQHPTTFYYHVNTLGPNYNQYYNLWDAQDKNGGYNITTATKKTVYDPCPPGFCLPTSRLFNYIWELYDRWPFKWDETNMVQILHEATPKVVFPVSSGRRSYDDGTIGRVGQDGYCWTATAEDRYNGLCFSWNIASRTWTGIRRALGAPVRAVAEE